MSSSSNNKKEDPSGVKGGAINLAQGSTREDEADLDSEDSPWPSSFWTASNSPANNNILPDFQDQVRTPKEDPAVVAAKVGDAARRPPAPVDGGPAFKDQVRQQQQQRRSVDPPRQQEREGIRDGPRFKDQCVNAKKNVPTNSRQRSPDPDPDPAPPEAEEAGQETQTGQPLPLTARVVDDHEIEEQIRRRILEEAAEAQVVTPSQLQPLLRDKTLICSKKARLYVVIGLVLVGIVLGVVLPLTLIDSSGVPVPTTPPPTDTPVEATPSPISGDAIAPSMSPMQMMVDDSSPPTVSPVPTISPAPTPSPPVPVTVAIQLDSEADETGWKLECGNQVYADYPFRTYSTAQATVTETVWVPDGAVCSFTLYDAGGDGLYACCDENGDRLQDSRYWVYLAADHQQPGISPVVEGSGDFDDVVTANFTATFVAPATALPSISPMPTQSPAPTAAPTEVTWSLLGENGDCSPGGGDSSSVLCNDGFSWPAEISRNGNIIAMTGIDIDFTRLLSFDQDSNTWVQRGQDIRGFPDDSREKYLALSGTGSVVAIGTTFSDALPGAVRVFRYTGQGNSWSQIGPTLDGLRDVDEWFSPTSLSHDGDIIAVGQRSYNDGVPNVVIGRVRAFRYSESSMDWLQLGQDIIGDEDGDWFGNSVSLSSDGYTVAVGAPFYGVDEDLSNGQAKVFQYNTTINEWKLLGEPIVGPEDFAELGWVVSMSGDGSTFVVGTYNEVVLAYRFQYSSNEWVQLGQDLVQQATDSDDGWLYGISVTISYDGNRLGIGRLYGPAVVLEYDDSGERWEQFGPALISGNANETHSHSVSISDDGRRLAVGGEFVSVFQKN